VPSNANDPATCGSATVDGAGFVAVFAPTATHSQQWMSFDRNGMHWGTFDASPALLAQSKGFIGVFGQPSFVTFWDEYGGPTPASTAATVVGPAFASGGIALSADAQALSVTKVDASGEALPPSASVSGAFTPLGAAEDATGAVLALVRSSAGVAGLWVDLTKGTATQPFSVGTGTNVKARPLLTGGIAIQLDGRWAGIAQPGESTLHPPPAWLGDAADFLPALAAKAYAVIPNGGSTVGIVSAQGNSCGSVKYPGVSSVSIGIDGTVVGSTGTAGCTRYVWRGALR
jgi:hypothetical protein